MSSPCVNIDEAGRDDAAVGVGAGSGTGSSLRSELVMVMARGVEIKKTRAKNSPFFGF